MKKQFLLPLVAVMVAAGGAFATTGFRAQAYGTVGELCLPGTLLEAESCSPDNEGDRCQVEIGNIEYDAWEDSTCETELFKPESR